VQTRATIRERERERERERAARGCTITIIMLYELLHYFLLCCVIMIL
jgi:hypothetical protein